jgi:hypothetical protein
MNIASLHALSSSRPAKCRGQTVSTLLLELFPGCRGTFEIDSNTARGNTGHFPDTYVDVRGWSKGLLFVNGVNLGWYWPTVGPQGAQYVPGPFLKPGLNEVILVEVEAAPRSQSGTHPPTPSLVSSQTTRNEVADVWPV